MFWTGEPGDFFVHKLRTPWQSSCRRILPHERSCRQRPKRWRLLRCQDLWMLVAIHRKMQGNDKYICRQNVICKPRNARQHPSFRKKIRTRQQIRTIHGCSFMLCRCRTCCPMALQCTMPDCRVPTESWWRTRKLGVKVKFWEVFRDGGLLTRHSLDTWILLYSSWFTSHILSLYCIALKSGLCL